MSTVPEFVVKMDVSALRLSMRLKLDNTKQNYANLFHMVTGITCLVYSVSYTHWPTSLNVIIIVTILNWRSGNAVSKPFILL